MWTTPHTRIKCPGLPVYPKYGHDPLLSKHQLGYAGYEIAERYLPTPSGCFRSSGHYHLLYDPTKAIKKQTQPRKRATFSVSEIFWPLTCEPFLADLVFARAIQRDDFFIQQQVSEIAYHLSLFNETEVQQAAGPYLHLKFAVCIIQRSYPAFQVSLSERAILLKSILAAYQKQKVAS